MSGVTVPQSMNRHSPFVDICFLFGSNKSSPFTLPLFIGILEVEPDLQPLPMAGKTSMGFL